MQRDPRIAARIKDVVEKRVGRELVSPEGDIVTEEIESTVMPASACPVRETVGSV